MTRSKELKALHNSPIVYCLEAHDSKYIKIGYTKNFRNRINDLQSGCPFRLSMMTFFKTNNPRTDEAYVLDMMSNCWVRGEWFAPSDDEIEALVDYFNNKVAEFREAHDALLQA